MDATSRQNIVAVSRSSTSAPEAPEAEGATWIDFGDGGSARWAGLSLPTLDQICAQLETIKPPDTLT